MLIHERNDTSLRRGTIHDVTCDSDGKIETFIGDRTPQKSLELHPFNDGDPYIIGIFLTGAYQEILGDRHNLFGDTNAVHFRLSTSNGGGYEETHTVKSDQGA